MQDPLLTCGTILFCNLTAEFSQDIPQPSVCALHNQPGMSLSAGSAVDPVHTAGSTSTSASVCRWVGLSVANKLPIRKWLLLKTFTGLLSIYKFVIRKQQFEFKIFQPQFLFISISIVLCFSPYPTLLSDPDCDTHNFNDDDLCGNSDDRSSSTTSSSRERDSKHCGCCYCEVFGHGGVMLLLPFGLISCMLSLAFFL